MPDDETSQAETEPELVGVVTVLHSRYGDTYKLPALNRDLWLSTARYTYVSWSIGGVVSAALTADGKEWRRAYYNWSAIQPGPATTLPADDPLVLDYQNACKEHE